MVKNILKLYSIFYMVIFIWCRNILFINSLVHLFLYTRFNDVLSVVKTYLPPLLHTGITKIDNGAKHVLSLYGVFQC
jgi:hypothetical protein